MDLGLQSNSYIYIYINSFVWETAGNSGLNADWSWQFWHVVAGMRPLQRRRDYFGKARFSSCWLRHQFLGVFATKHTRHAGCDRRVPRSFAMEVGPVSSGNLQHFSKNQSEKENIPQIHTNHIVFGFCFISLFQFEALDPCEEKPKGPCAQV